VQQLLEAGHLDDAVQHWIAVALSSRSCHPLSIATPSLAIFIVAAVGIVEGSPH
jgi:hypothetical protein